MHMEEKEEEDVQVENKKVLETVRGEHRKGEEEKALQVEEDVQVENKVDGWLGVSSGRGRRRRRRRKMYR